MFLNLIKFIVWVSLMTIALIGMVIECAFATVTTGLAYVIHRINQHQQYVKYRDLGDTSNDL